MTQQVDLKVILCPTDFSEPSKKAVNYALALGQAFNAKIILLHVVETVLSSALLGHAISIAAQLEQEMETQGKKHLAEIKEKSGYENMHCKLIRGIPGAQGILDEAANAEVDLIVLGTHGRSGLSHLLIGSTAEKVVRKAPCPVLTVKSVEHDFVKDDGKPAEGGE